MISRIRPVLIGGFRHFSGPKYEMRLKRCAGNSAAVQGMGVSERLTHIIYENTQIKKLKRHLVS